MNQRSRRRGLSRAFSCAVLCATTALCGLPAGAVTLEGIMADPDWIGNGPEDPFWSEDGRFVYFERKRPGDEVRELWGVSVEGSDIHRIPPQDLSSVARPGGDYSSDSSLRVWEHSGDLFVLTVRTGEVRQLTRTSEREASPRFLLGGRRIAFERGERTLVFDLDNGLVSEPVELRFEKDPDVEEEEFDYLAAKQLRLYRKLAEAEEDERAEREHDRELQEVDPARPPLPWYMGDEIEVAARYLSPGADWMLLVTEAKSDDSGRKGSMPNYVTRSGYVEAIELRTRVGRDAPGGHSLVLVDLERHERHELDLAVLPGIQDDPLVDLRKAAVEWHAEKGADRERVEKHLEAPETRPVTVAEAVWSENGRTVAVELHSVDNKDRWIATVELDDAKLVSRHRLTDPAWINWSFNELGILRDGKSLWYLSEEDGYSHLYLLDLETSERRRLTSGDYEVSSPEPSRDGAHIYYQANVDHPGVYEIYRVEVATGRVEQLTTLGGVNEYRLAPDESKLLVIHSEIDMPPDLWVQPAAPAAAAMRITETTSEAFRAIDWIIPEIVEVPSTHVERPIYSKLYKPPDFDPAASHPAVVFVHGAGYLQNSHKGWAGYFREFMFHTLLVEHGYLVLDMDYRASAGYGRDWRTAIYRQMGHPELEDLQDGVAWLVEHHSVDPRRVGVYGGSYGGFMTFMALFRDPDLFAAGAALRPVTDWAHYNHDYTSNILNTPELDPIAFERSSPIEYVEHLARPLLIASGMQDDNVFFQDTVLLVQRLIELKKQDFETAFYPLDPHGFVHPESWLDEYRRIFKLFERYVRPE